MRTRPLSPRPLPLFALACSFSLTLAGTSLALESPARSVVILCGHPGDEGYARSIEETAELWESLATEGQAEVEVLDKKGGASLLQTEETLSRVPHGSELWLVLLGHGTHDGEQARFNLAGPDLSAQKLAGILAPRTATTVLINTTASSAPFLETLSGQGRVIVSATKSGQEIYTTRFGKFLAQAYRDPAADRDQDDQISLLEAFLTGAALTAESYRAEGQLATEHPLIDDNGDRIGSRFEWFDGLEPKRFPRDKAKPDGSFSHRLHLIPSAFENSLTRAQRERRDILEQQVIHLRSQRPRPPDEAFYDQLEPIVLELAEIYAPIPQAPDSSR